MSPFCVKLETYLRMTKIEHRVEAGDPRKAPKGKIPYIQDGDALMGDSQLIIEYLKKKHGDPLDAKLTDVQRAQALMLRQSVEEHLYFAMAWLRWGTDESWQHVRAYFSALLPPVVGPFVIGFLRKRFLKNLYGQGMARHSRKEILEKSYADLDACSTLLGDKPFFLGDEPTSIDATMFGFGVNVVGVPWEAPEKKYFMGKQNLVDYVHRMKKRYFAEQVAK
jgi:glutathione S-transferase